MTRINLIDPQELTDQHLMREYQELPRILGNVRRAVAAGKHPKNFKIPSQYVLGTGHMTFFYDKLQFLRDRQKTLIAELIKRKYKISFTDGLDLSEFKDEWLGNYQPDSKAVALSRERIKEKIDMKRDWYKYYGQSFNEVDKETQITVFCDTP